MLRLSKKTEYGLMAVHLLANRGAGSSLSVSEIANECNISEPLLSKILQTLRKHEMVTSVRGPRGGYTLNNCPAKVSFLTFIQWFEERVTVVECAENGLTGCAQFHTCCVRSPLLNLNEKLHSWLNTVTLAEVFGSEATAQHPHLEPVAKSGSLG